jgi:hypothetical protein
MIEMVDYTRIVNNDNAMVDLFGKTEDTFLYICTGARVAQFSSGNSNFQNVVTQLGFRGGASISVNFAHCVSLRMKLIKKSSLVD